MVICGHFKILSNGCMSVDMAHVCITFGVKTNHNVTDKVLPLEPKIQHDGSCNYNF